ncbi:TRAP transporter small permease [Arthrobacter sp. APC 3897]|uniref:TRAP transporter small permease n=1 Tax=Arthrobacter sp. APC 3897 TaxID=3035204 RepID=UPI0025B3D956|nr:TRAP transporter small permease [Arthrobacter sp. APC 3897]MDN3480654.1 TRAP transporter small permease [Arthrobacter sp. APC 3897]
MNRLTEGLKRVLLVLTAIAVVTTMLHVVAHGLLRFFFNAPIHGTTEIVSFWYMPVIALLGIPAAHLQKEHITVTLLVENVGWRIQRIFLVFACVMGAMVSVGFSVFGFQKALDKMSVGATAGVTDIISWPVYFLVPLVFVVLAVLYVNDIVVACSNGPEVVSPREPVKAKPSTEPLSEAPVS